MLLFEELLPPQPTRANIVIRRMIPRMAMWRRLRLLLAPTKTRPKRPKPPRLAKRVGSIGLEFGRTGATSEAVVAAVVVRVSVVLP